MGFSSEWESIYSANQQISIWPWSDLVSYVMRYYKPNGKNFKVLELGCGAGANISFFQHLNAEYYATEGSDHIVKFLGQKYPSLSDKIKVTDFTTEIPFDFPFDLIFDRASITHNNTKAIENCISLISKHLKTGGLFVGIDWFSTAHGEFSEGVSVDKNTKEDFQNGQFKNVGKVHFSDKAHLMELFKDFEFITMEHKIVQQEYPKNAYPFASWNFCVKKI